MISEELTQSVTKALIQDKRTKDAPIEVINQNGILTLKGHVKNDKIRKAAENIAMQQPGVISVINELKI
jgi:osmotically-inducible protein OsmY